MTKKNKNVIKAINLANKIQKIRAKNNKNWMDLLKLSLHLDLKKTSIILKNICKEDKKVSLLANRIFRIK
jgi:hypothetical protein